MATALCQRWEDLSPMHRQIREEIEEIIRRYTNNESINPIIINAPYGSGKTTLLKHLLCFSVRNNILAIKVNLSKISQYIEEKLKKEEKQQITEDELPRYINEFYRDLRNKVSIYLSSGKFDEPTTKDIVDEYITCCGLTTNQLLDLFNRYSESIDNAILLIDEVEESYGTLKTKITYGTTPFRGLFDAVRERKTPFLILAFGPSTIYSEAVTQSATWRVVVKTIPLLAPDDIRKFSIQNPHVRNLLWWIGKGRPGHILRLIQEKIHERATNAVERCEKPDYSSLIGQTITENMPYVDISEYDRKLSEISDENERKLFQILSVRIGPVAEKQLPGCIDISKLKNTSSKYIVKNNKVINVSDLINKLKNHLKSFGVDDVGIELVTAIFSAWSDQQIIIYEKSALLALFELAKDVAVEFQQEKLFEILTNNLSSLITEVENLSIESDYYYALHPLTISSIYPLLLLNPLIRCSKNKPVSQLYDELSKKIDDIIVKDINKIEEINIKLIQIIYKKDTEEFLRDAIYPLFLPAEKLLETQIIEFIKSLILNNRSIILIPIGQSDAYLERLENIWKNYVELGLIKILIPSPRLSLFLAGALYNAIDCAVPLSSAESRTLLLYTNALRQLIDESKAFIKENKNKLLLKIDNIEKNLYEIWSKGYRIGKDNTKHLLLLSIAEVNAEQLNNIFSTISEVLKYGTELCRAISQLAIETKCNISRGIGELMKYGENFFETFDSIYKFAKTIPELTMASHVLFELSKLPDIIQFNVLESKINELKKMSENLFSIKEPLSYIPAIEVLKTAGIKVRIENSKYYNEISKLIRDLDSISNELKALLETISKYIDHDNIGLKTLNKIYSLQIELIKRLQKVSENGKEFCKDEVVMLSDGLFKNFICDAVLDRLVTNIEKNMILPDLYRKFVDSNSSLKEIYEKISLCLCPEKIRYDLRADLESVFGDNLPNFDIELFKIKEILDEIINELNLDYTNIFNLNIYKKIEQIKEFYGA
jgi:hypothetical protein